MTEIFDIAGYARISFEDDDIKDKDNTSIENQRSLRTLSIGSSPAPG